MIKNPRVSIIIPALNVADTIERCVNSALAQTYPNTEVIVVEGDSSDGTRFLLKNIEDRNNLESSKRLKVFYTTFDNIATARNTGLSRATGQYVFWLEPTDYLDMKAVEHYVEIVTRTGADMVKNTCKDSMTGTITFDRVAYIRMILNGSIDPVISGSMFKKDLYHNISFDRRSSIPEIQNYLSVCEKCRNITLIRRNDLYHYFPSTENESLRTIRDKAIITELTYEKYVSSFPYECEEVLKNFTNYAVKGYYTGRRMLSEEEDIKIAEDIRLLILNHELSIEKNKLIAGYTKRCVQAICRNNRFISSILKLFWKS